MAKDSFDLNKFRLDFVVRRYEEVGEDKEGNKIVKIAFELDPKKWKYDSEKEEYLNEQLGIVITKESLKKALPTLTGKPIYSDQTFIMVDEEYIKRIKDKYDK